MGNVEFYLLSFSTKPSRAFSHFHETRVAIPIPVGFSRAVFCGIIFFVVRLSKESCLRYVLSSWCISNFVTRFLLLMPKVVDSQRRVRCIQFMDKRVGGM